MGQFDQAIACWRRVELARPQDDDARQAIARLSVEKTIHQGGYDPALLSGGGSRAASVARMAQAGGAAEDPETTALPTEDRLRAAVDMISRLPRPCGCAGNAEAFSRMFERDKNELRDLGIPLETGRTSVMDVNDGYRINRTAYELPPVELTAAMPIATSPWVAITRLSFTATVTPQPVPPTAPTKLVSVMARSA